MSARRVRVPPFKACRKCKSLVPREASRCPVCGSTDLSEDWEGALVVIDPEKSVIAKKLEITKPGRYAIKVR
ncbi:transcription elongation factor subunit Spt4 [Pyrodictium abyssi]|uniref:Transcription elongation factor Spt4 n=1 Tax=Pyrodictium abyssi TaxID=54256 RepID=A0ABN6ZQR2_9CREN|nr:DNA-binding protein [Pyrodictium abyssi]